MIERYRHLIEYVMVAIASLGMIAWGLRLDHTNLRMPLSYHGDAILMLMFVKGVVDNGHLLEFDRLSAPEHLEMYDFTQPDLFIFSIIYGLGKFDPDPVLVTNLFYILSFPLTALTTLFSVRRLGISFPAAAIGAFAYTFLPYHYYRGTYHLLYSMYFILPFIVLVSIWIAIEPASLFMRSRFFPFSRRTGFAAGVCLLLSGTGTGYFPFFGCVILAVAGVYSWLNGGKWHAILATFLLVGVITTGVLVCSATTLLYQQSHGLNDISRIRAPEEAELAPLKPIQLVLPVPDHRFGPFRRLAMQYDSPGRVMQFEYGSTALGAFGTVGLLILAFVGCRRDTLRPGLIHAAAVLTLFLIFLGCLGGIGSAFNFFVFPQIRSYNRVVIALALYPILASCWALDRVFTNFKIRSPIFARRAIPIVCSLMSLLVFIDQTGRDYGSIRRLSSRWAEGQNDYRRDGEFGAFVESTLEPGSMVFQLPYLPFPDPAGYAPPPRLKSTYAHLGPWLQTKTIRWSFASIKGREVDTWQRRVAFLPPNEMCRELVLAGFSSVMIDRRAYEDDARLRIQELTSILGPPLAHSTEDTRVIFLLADYKKGLLKKLGEEGFQAAVRASRERPCILFPRGIFTHEPPWLGNQKPLYHVRPYAEMTLVNPADHDQEVTLRFWVRSPDNQSVSMQISGPGLSDDHPAGLQEQRVYRLTLTPGRSNYNIYCDPPREDSPGFAYVASAQMFDVTVSVVSK